MPPMPTAPVIRADEPETIAETPHLELLPSPAAHDKPAEAVRISASSPPAVPVAIIATPAGPTARIHWIGGFVDLRHPADLYQDMVAGTPNLVVVDARYVEAYAREHLPGAINLPWRELDETTTAHLSREALYVVYCWNAACHASAKTARRLEALGFKVKELHGGLETWRKQGYPTEKA
jgi:rhodanese-related sulfurtransferase